MRKWLVSLGFAHGPRCQRKRNHDGGGSIRIGDVTSKTALFFQLRWRVHSYDMV